MTPSNPRVSVVMALYNAETYLRQAIGSVLAQTYSDFELLIVDDCSTDHSLAIARSFGDGRIRILRHQTNVGAAASRNEAMTQARGEFIAIMDADDVCAPNRLERQIAFLDGHPATGLVGCGLYDNIDDRGNVLYRSTLPEDNATLQHALMKRWCFLHPSIMFRSRLLKHTGGYRSAFEVAEDHDFILRLLEHGEAHNIHEPLVNYRINPKGLSVTGHRYMDALAEAAIRLAEQRRSGRGENLELEAERWLALKAVSCTRRGKRQRWLNSLYAANRYYGFGCREFCGGRLRNARRCFASSLRTNALFVKSWIGLALTFAPPAVAQQLRLFFSTSMNEELQEKGNGQCGFSTSTI